MSMEKLHVLLLDDEQTGLEYSKTAIASFVPEQNIYAASSAVGAMRILESRPVDLAFLDIEMPDTNGFSAAEYIHSTYPQIKIVFLTGHVELGAKSFDYEPLDFLTKPIDVMRLSKTLNRYESSRKVAAGRKGLVAVDTGAGLVMLSPENILYISKEKRKTVIHCADRDYTVKNSLEEMEAVFEDFGMFRSHQSFLVPLDRIVSVQPADFGKTYTVQLSCGLRVPMSRSQYGKLRDRLTDSGIRIL
jgi:two-component system, LytTR family, response regulator